MLRRGLWEIARKSSKSGRATSLLSCNHHFAAYTNETLSTVSVSRISTIYYEKKQTLRRFSDASNLSPKTEIMDGGGDRKILTIDYETLLKAQEKGDFIIDVREQNEINETGKLPGSIHIPMGDVTNQLQTLSGEAFQTKFEKSKPEKDTKIILSCRSGMRSGKVQEQLQKLGYENVYNYTGGWMDWESRQKV